MDNIMVMQSTEYRYHIDAKGAIVLDQYILNGNDYVIVPEKIAECTVTEIGENAFTNHEEIKEIIFPNSLEKIADRAFLDVANLKKLSLEVT